MLVVQPAQLGSIDHLDLTGTWRPTTPFLCNSDTERYTVSRGSPR